MLRIEKKENIMAKYLDQTGVQHLAEALVQNTKTVGGQSIWGSGDIEIGSSNSSMPLIRINNDGDWNNNQYYLESVNPKIVVFNAFAPTSLNSADVQISNAIIYTTGDGLDLSKMNSLGLYGCKTGGHIDPGFQLFNYNRIRIPGVSTGNTKTSFIEHCSLDIAHIENKEYFAQMAEVNITYSHIRFYRGTKVDGVTIYVSNSDIDGLVFRNSGVNSINFTNSVSTDQLISSRITNGVFPAAVSIIMGGYSKNISWEYCKISSETDGDLYNITHSVITDETTYDGSHPGRDASVKADAGFNSLS